MKKVPLAMRLKLCLWMYVIGFSAAWVWLVWLSLRLGLSPFVAALWVIFIGTQFLCSWPFYTYLYKPLYEEADRKG
jgi:hypothetical protein